MNDASPRPWKSRRPGQSIATTILDHERQVVCGFLTPENAALIFRSVNAAEDLAEALRDFVTTVEHVDPGVYIGCVEDARAALKKWEGNVTDATT